MSNTVFRPYQSKLYPNSRKAPMVKNTFEWLHRAYGSFFDMIIALYGGLQHKDVSNLLSENDDRITDPDLICAINWFRVCPCSGNPSPVSDLQTRIDRFRQYAGHEPSHIASAYLSAPIDVEKDEWVDCRQLYQQFCQTVGANLDVDLSTLVQSGLLPVVKDDNLNPYSSKFIADKVRLPISPIRAPDSHSMATKALSLGCFAFSINFLTSSSVNKFPDEGLNGNIKILIKKTNKVINGTDDNSTIQTEV